MKTWYKIFNWLKKNYLMQIFNYNIIMYENNADLKGLCMYTETEITGVDPNNKKKKLQ